MAPPVLRLLFRSRCGGNGAEGAGRLGYVAYWRMDTLDATAMRLLLELGLSALLFCCREGSAESRICKQGPGFSYVGNLTAFTDPGSFLALQSALLVAGSGTKFWSIEGY